MQPTDDAVTIKAGGESGLILVVTKQALEVQFPTVTWLGHTPVPSSRLWRRVATNLEEAAYEDLLKRALRARRKQFKRCRCCGETYPPEHRHARDICHGCAERHLGILH